MELPEITILSQQMNDMLSGKTFDEVTIGNEKVLNVKINDFKGKIIGSSIESVHSRGKWIFINLDSNQTILYNTGMGADTLYYSNESQIPENYHHQFKFTDNSGFTIKVWWFAHIHLMPNNKLEEHKQTGNMGISPLDKKFSLEHFKNLLKGRRGGIKSFLTNQKNIGGIGNVYIHDPLFLAGLHPLRKINTVPEEQIMELYDSIKFIIKESIKAGGLAYEKKFFGDSGKYGKDYFRVAYKEGEACPVCGTLIEKIKTGSTSSYICITCQPLES
jgi:formamidopyrimidine-DNA glycosylase